MELVYRGCGPVLEFERQRVRLKGRHSAFERDHAGCDLTELVVKGCVARLVCGFVQGDLTLQGREIVERGGDVGGFVGV